MPEFDSSIEYRDIEGFPGYKVGSDGHVWSCRVFNRWHRTGPWKQLRPGINKISGHRMLVLHPGRLSIQVHRLVMNAFRGPCPAGLEVCHGDDDTSNNQLSNLRYDTHKGNMADASRNGRMRTKLSAAQVVEIRRRYAAKEATQVELAAQFKVRQSTISAIVRWKIWIHVNL